MGERELRKSRAYSQFPGHPRAEVPPHGREARRPKLRGSAAYLFASTFMAFRRFTDVALMIRSDVGVTRTASLALDMVLPWRKRLAFTSFLECLPATPKVFCFFVILSFPKPNLMEPASYISHWWTSKRAALNIFNQYINPFYDSFVGFLPIQVTIPGFG